MLFEIRSDVVYSHERVLDTVEAESDEQAWAAFDALGVPAKTLAPAYGQRKPRALFRVGADGTRTELVR